ncbi:DNA (cytosine-5)-methyltransferase 1-like [Micractinium conductrix]|uniref:DNA (cytosine-5)-methyltransferase n=1 Tax=Micractinium conductrix TaxID=554055 RepID=A0A2P6VP80_9CHLO|nr:DNA (cytosine-5)-methyltransferase 1-like [Micractinium conductrix]|eukprot:PSC75867.1 DNA (cytosine-5)-methyltransferase 1-like [Micractinium conductrix]
MAPKAKKGAYVEVGAGCPLDSIMAGGKKGAAKRDAGDKPAAKEPKKAKKEAQQPAKEAPAGDVDMAEAAPEVVGSGRQAAQNVSYKDQKGALRETKADMVAVKEEARCDSEKDALKETENGGAWSDKQRRLGDFSVVDEAGIAEPVEGVEYAAGKLFLSGLVYPKEGPTTKETGRRLDKFGPLTSFSLDFSDKKGVQVIAATVEGQYLLTRPAASYKKVFEPLAEKAAIAFEVHTALSPQLGGSAFASLEEVVARLARAKACKGYPSAREGLLVNAKFLLGQFEKLDSASGHKALKFLDTDFGKSLAKEAAGYKYVGSQKGNGIVIRDMEAEAAAATAAAATKGKGKAKVGEVAEADKQLEADEELARQLQAKMDAEMRAKRPGAPKGKATQAYMRVSEAEIADDYPAPQAYRKEEEETDELLLFDEECMDLDPEYLPRRLLTDFSIYNAEGMFSSLELLPMWSGVDPDVELYASGVVVDDDGDFSGGQALNEDTAGASGAGSSGASGSGAGGSSAAAAAASAPGMRMYLSQIREWVVDFGADMLFISIRTDVAWYRLSVPTAKYAPWFGVPLKCARLAVKVLQLLSSETRASKLSFADIVKRLAAEEEGKPTFVSKKVDAVERFVVAHGQIFLNQFQNYPVKEVKNSAFVSTLRERMQHLRHSKLYKQSKKEVLRVRAVNRNPTKNQLHDVARSRPMTATATRMVKAVWQAYFRPAGAKEGEEEPTAKEVEEDENEEEAEDDVQEDALAAGGSKGKKAAPAKKKSAAKGAWVGAVAKTVDGDKFYSKAKLGDFEIALGDAVELSAEDDEEAAPLALVQAMWQNADGSKEVQVRLLARGEETVLGDAASDSEVFLTTDLETRELSSVTAKASVSCLERAWDSSKRQEHFKVDKALRERNEEAAREGLPLELFWRRQYVPTQGMFCDPPADLQLGTRLPEGDGKPEKGVKLLADGKSFVKDGVEYREGDFMFVGPQVFDQLEDAKREVELPEYLKNSRFHKGSYEGLRAWGICQLVRLGADKKGADKKGADKKGKKAKKGSMGSDSEEEVEVEVKTKKGGKKGGDASKLAPLTVKRFWRPEDISADQAYKAASYYEVYASEEELSVSVEDVVGRCRVVPKGCPTGIDTFECAATFARKGKKFSAAPELEIPADLAERAGGSAAAAKAPKADKKGKGKVVEEAAPAASRIPGDDGIALKTMDIFAGCGGLSEGMHQAGAAISKWGIEYERPAAAAFEVNNPDAAVFCNNCNVLLHAAMVKGGEEDDCDACDDAREATKTLPDEQMAALPLPGQVDFICGGPPCQGYSGMNRFNKGNWSMVQNSMVMAFLSYADFYRPRYFLLENVRNFVSHNKSFTFRLTLRSLLDMGYQVRFGVLNAGNFGVAQSRKRTFIWAAAPGELLPDWPRLMHCFRTPQLTINLPGGVQYCAVPQTVGAPLRPVTVRDAIADLPAIQNGHMVEEMEYVSGPVSAFQQYVRGDCTNLTDHISKQMNELNLERCRCIPKNCPGADWRVLEEIVKADPSREKYKGQPLVPWCLPNTADRHNGWRGLFGRLDWSGHFPTSTTDPQPMGKVGQVFHPEQDRIVSVRECARAQGFPDKHRFVGNVHNKHRQVGNAVPPPLAAALGRELRKALEKTAAKKDQ